MGTLWKQSKGSVWGFGAGEGAGNKAEGDRDALAGLWERKRPVQPPVLTTAPQTRALPEGGLGVCPQNQDSWCSPMRCQAVPKGLT